MVLRLHFLTIFVLVGTHGTSLSSPFVAEELKVFGEDLVTNFTVKVASCTGTLISNRWVLTAAHCFHDVLQSFDEALNEFGDMEYTYLAQDEVYVQVGLSSIRVEKVILDGRFEGEALSWKGHDLALARLEEEAPHYSNICFETDDNFEDLNSEDTFMAGYGRIYIPHCITNMEGPVAFGVCSRPANCVRDHRTRRCGVEFEYQGRVHNECIKGPTPSSQDPDCNALRGQESFIEQESDIAHIYDSSGEEYLTTCFFRDANSNNSAGWCVTRQPGVEQREGLVEGNKGWGFCSSDESQKYCNGIVPENMQTLKAMKVAVLNEEFCEDKLGDNLHVEQPETTKEEYENLLQKSGVICVGRNITRDDTKDLFFRKVSNDSFERVEHSGEVFNKHLIDGGPACFGDSGGPLFKLVRQGDGEEPVPALIGVFSFLLWGTCRGTSEPSFYLRVKHYKPWLDNYLSSEDLVACRSRF